MIAIQSNEARQPRVAICPLGGSGVGGLAALLDRRGIATQIATIADARGADVGAIAAVARSGLTESMCLELAPLCLDAARGSRPVVVLATLECFKNPLSAATLSAYLRDHGALVFSDPDVWLETIVLVAAYGLPRGPHTALVLSPGGWLDDSARALADERDSGRLDARRIDSKHPEKTSSLDKEPTDVVLCDVELLPTTSRFSDVMVVGVCGRGELIVAGAPPMLVGLRTALIATREAGRLRQRIDAGLDAPEERGGPDDFDVKRIAGQLEKVRARAGDHETKVMLKAAGVEITRQAVATTASAATRLAKRAGYPVEMKAWGAHVADERSGALVETGLRTAADVRRAFAAICGQQGAAIVRETPPVGREMAVEIRSVGSLGMMMIVRIDGSRQPLAAVSPLSQFDADRLSVALSATRQGDPPPSPGEIANLLLRASYLVRDFEQIRSLAMPRIVATSKGAVVIDAWATLA